MTHKLATWIDQFGTSGCVGCGRCITWCPVGIDITEEVAAIRADDGRAGRRSSAAAMKTMEDWSARCRRSPVSSRHLELVAGCAKNVALRRRRATCSARATPPSASTWSGTGGGARDPRAGRGPVVIETLHDGDVVGWSWLFPPYRWQFDARALEPSRAIAFDGACLRGKCEADHELGYELMRRFAGSIIERLQATRLRLLDVYGSRVARVTARGATRCCRAFRVDRLAPGDRRHLDARGSSPATARRRSPSPPGSSTMVYAFGVGEVPISISGDRSSPGHWSTRSAPSARRRGRSAPPRPGRARRPRAVRKRGRWRRPRAPTW